MEDVFLLLSGAEGLAIGPHEPEVPRSVLAARCFEVIKEKYRGLPFAVKWELASSTVAQQLAEQKVRHIGTQC